MRHRNYRKPRRSREVKSYQRIEFPSAGATYSLQEYGVYEYSTYPSGSVLAGQQSRVFLDSFETLEEAKAKYPDAEPGYGCGYREPSLNHLPEDEDDLETYEREELRKEQFSETDRGYEARDRWARRYDDLNGAPESEDDR
jgi:hypothetical protein